MKTEVTKETRDLLEQIVAKNHAELAAVHEEVRQARSEGAGRDVGLSAEVDREKSMQIILRANKEKLKKCVVVPKPKNTGIVQIGSRVRVNLGGNKTEFTMDGLALSKEFCSLSSPLGRKISGKRVGEKVFFRNNEVEILSVS
jgi:transcription elongation GreA/GreB family factor